MDLNYPNLNYSVREKLMKDLKKIIKISMKACRMRLKLRNIKYCYEIFGYDFILDSNLKPYLLEVNTNPGMEESSPICDELIPRMIEDSLRLTLDPIFSEDDINPSNSPNTKNSNINRSFDSKPKENYNTTSEPAKNSVKGYTNAEIMYDYVCSL